MLCENTLIIDVTPLGELTLILFFSLNRLLHGAIALACMSGVLRGSRSRETWVPNAADSH